MQFISFSMISRSTNVFAARLVRHRPGASEFPRGGFDVWPCILVIIYVIRFCREKNIQGKNIYGGRGSANLGNISLKFEVNSTLILPVKCPLTKLEDSQCYKLTFSSINERIIAFLNCQSCEEWMEHCKHVHCTVNALPKSFHAHY